MNIKPSTKPKNPFFSSGPCSKRPGWKTNVLSNAILGRSHRSKIALKRIKNVLELTKELLNIPKKVYLNSKTKSYMM